MKTVCIAIEQIAEGYNPRKDLDGKDELKKSIEREGRLLDPITVRPVGEQFVIVDGHRRFSAIKELGWEKVNAFVEEIDEKTAAHMAWVKNSQRRNFNPIETASHLKEMKTRYGYNIEDLVRLGYAPQRSTLDNLLSLLTLPEEIQEKIAAGEINQTNGYQLARISDPEIQKKLAEEIATKEITGTRKVKNKVDAFFAAQNRPEEKAEIPVPQGDIPGVFFKDAQEMSEIPDESVHLVVTSPPYGVGLEYEQGVTLDDHLNMMDAVLGQCAKKLVPGGIIFLNFGDVHNFGTVSGRKPEIFLMGPHYQAMLRKHGIRLTDQVIWEKAPNWVNNPQVSYSERTRHTSWRFLNNTEHLWIFRKEGDRQVPVDSEYESKITKEAWKEWVAGVWKINAVGKQKDHPAQFPEELVSRAIKMFSYIGDVVLDPFLGSGTTVKVARELGRQGIGYERDLKFKSVIMKKLGIEILEETPSDSDQPEILLPSAPSVQKTLNLIDDLVERLRDQGRDLSKFKTIDVPLDPENGSPGEVTIEWEEEPEDPDNDGSGGDTPRPSFTDDDSSTKCARPDTVGGPSSCLDIVEPSCSVSIRSGSEAVTRLGIPDNTIVHGDCFQILKEIEDESVDLVFTSPPYADLKDYGPQVSVPHPDHYVDWFLPLFDQFHRILKKTGSLVINIGGKVVNKRRHPFIHELIVRACRETRMEFYDEYFWSKQVALPNGSNRRLNTTTEYLLHFCKNPDKVKWNMDAVREEYAPQTLNRSKYAMSGFDTIVDESGNRLKRHKKMVALNPKGKRPSNVFQFQTACVQREHNHPAAFHEDMPAWFIKALTDDSDLVLDPFAGSGTTCLAAKKLGRRNIGIELNQEYWKAATRRIAAIQCPEVVEEPSEKTEGNMPEPEEEAPFQVQETFFGDLVEVPQVEEPSLENALENDYPDLRTYAAHQLEGIHCLAAVTA